MLTKTKSGRALIGVLLTAVLVGGVAMFGDRVVAQQQGQQKGQITSVGTYQPQSLFKSSPPGKKLLQDMQSLQGQMQQAQQSGDQQKLVQLQTQIQQQQQQAVKEFTTLVGKAVPKVAQQQGVQVVAVQVTYTAPGIKTKDITNALVKEMGGQAAAPQRPPLSPPQPGQTGTGRPSQPSTPGAGR